MNSFLFQPVRFCNLNHESVFRKIFALLFLEALIPPTVDLIYTHGRSHNHNDCPRIMDVVLGSVILSFPRCWGGGRKKQYFLGLKVFTKNSTDVSQDYFFFEIFKNIPPKKVLLLFHVSQVSGIHNMWKPFTKLLVFVQNKISETSTIFQDFLSDQNSFQWNLNINLLVNILNFCFYWYLVWVHIWNLFLIDICLLVYLLTLCFNWYLVKIKLYSLGVLITTAIMTMMVVINDLFR